MVELQLPKLVARVRFPSLAPPDEQSDISVVERRPPGPWDKVPRVGTLRSDASDPWPRCFSVMACFSLYSEKVLRTEELALRVLRRALPHVDVRPTPGGDLGNVVLRSPDGSSCPVQVTWAGAGFPRDVERALSASRGGDRASVMVVARSLSPGARTMLDDDDVSWLTESGAARVHVGSIIVEREGHAPSGTPTPPDGELRWAPAIAAVAEVVLADHVRTRSHVVPLTTVLASRSGRSAGSVTAALQAFDRARWTQPSQVSRGPSARRRLVDISTMLDSWAGWVSRHDHVRAVRYHSVHREPELTARELQSAFTEGVALGGRFAADLVAPFSSSVRTLRCYLDAAIDDVSLVTGLAAAGLTQSDESRRVEILRAPRSVMSTSERRDGHRVVSPVRMYADLLLDGARGEDAARHLRDVALGG